MSHCLCLENLTLDNCDTYMVNLSSTTLKFLKICRMEVTEIKMFAINLEIFEIDAVYCDPKNITFETPKVHFLRSCCDDSKIGKQYVCWVGSKLLQSRNGSNQIPQGSTSSFSNKFENLDTLCIDLDLEKLENSIALYSALKSCPKLKNLEINIQVNNDVVRAGSDGDGHNGGDYFSHPEIFF